MNYIREMNAFMDWLETNPLDASAQTLWFHLMAVANKSGWPEWFAVTNHLLQAKVGISENSLTKHRNVLVQKGRIEYKSQGKKQAGKYRIIPFTAKFEVMEGVNREVIRGVNRAVKGSALFKVNKTKENSGGDWDDFGLDIDPNYAKAIQAIEAQFPARINPKQSELLEEYLSTGLDPKIVSRAVDITRLNGKDIGYLWGILAKCVERGILTISAFDAAQNKKAQQGTKQQDKAAYFAQRAREQQDE